MENWQVSVRDHEADYGEKKRQTSGHTARGRSVSAFLLVVSHSFVKSSRDGLQACGVLFDILEV